MSNTPSPRSPRLSIPTQKPVAAQPEMVGPFILGKTLGRGTTGKVKVAKHKDSGLEVAIKIVKKEYLQTHRKKLGREIAVMRLIDHPHVMKLYDVFESNNNMFLVLERVKGGELFDYILQKGRLPREEALRIMSQIVQGVEYCHEHHVCHRDLKPENLLLDENRNIKIADFGMAQIAPGGKVLETFCGSPHYGSPEVVSGIRYDGRTSDVWSLGVVFYALITGMLPFDNPNISKLLKMVKRGVYHMPKFVPEDIADLIRQMLTLDPDKRIKTPELKFHHCWNDQNGKNIYFPASPRPSPAIERLKSHPIEKIEDIDMNIVTDLKGLGWGSEEEVCQRMLSKRSDSLTNLELIFYNMLAARKESKNPEDENYSRAVGSPPPSPSPSSPRGSMIGGVPPSPLSGKRPSVRVHLPTNLAVTRVNSVAGSTTGSPSMNMSSRAEPDVADYEGVPNSDSAHAAPNTPPPPSPRRPTITVQTSEPASPAKEQPTTPLAVRVESEANQISTPIPAPTQEDANSEIKERKGREGGKLAFKGPKLVVEMLPKQYEQKAPLQVGAGAAPSAAHEYSTTPRFHRLKLINSSDNLESPAVPITPTAKRSWFKTLFRRRPSTNVVDKKQANHGASGLYSQREPVEVRKDVQMLLEKIGVSMKIGSQSDYELKCEANMYMDDQSRVFIYDKLGQQCTYHSESKLSESKGSFEQVMEVDNDKDFKKKKLQIIKFTVDISREESDKVTCVNFNHRSGEQLFYRGLYNEIMKHMAA